MIQYSPRWEGITIIVLEEILMANGLTVLMMWFLLLCRRKNRESLHVGDKIYDGMAIVNLLGALSETIAFLVDGKQFIGSRQINYVSNSICFIGTVSIGLLWCLYVELRIYRNYKRIFKKARFVMFPWVVEVIMVLCNLLGTGIMFKISEGNIYQRAAGAIVGYISLIIYFCIQYIPSASIQETRDESEFFPCDIFRWSLFCRSAYPVSLLWNHIVMGIGCGCIDICADAVICREFIYG